MKCKFNLKRTTYTVNGIKLGKIFLWFFFQMTDAKEWQLKWRKMTEWQVTDKLKKTYIIKVYTSINRKYFDLIICAFSISLIKRNHS